MSIKSEICIGECSILVGRYIKFGMINIELNVEISLFGVINIHITTP